MVWLSGLSAGLQIKKLQVQFPVRAHAWVTGQVPSRGRVQEATTHCCFFPSLSPSLPLSLKINKNFYLKKEYKRIKFERSHRTFTKTDHSQGHKWRRNTFQKLEAGSAQNTLRSITKMWIHSLDYDLIQ